MHLGFGPRLAAAVAAFAPLFVIAQPQTESVEYRHNDTVLEGFLALPEGDPATRPGVLVIHDWTGIQDETKRRTRMLAELGFVAFAADIYGQGVRPSNPKESGAEAGKYKGNTALFRARLNAGLDALRQRCDPQQVAAIGYCFGGAGVLELARSGADLRGVVSFHGGLKTDQPAQADTLKAKILVLHGAVDPHVPPAEVQAFQDEMKAADADWHMVSYGSAVHSFTKPGAGDDPSKGAAFNAKADARSWEHMRLFFNEIFP